MDVKMSDAVKETVTKRGLKEADVKDVVETGESSKKKIVNKSGKVLAKKSINNVTVYADYNIEKGLLKSHANVNSAYSHRMVMGTIVNATEKSDWTCMNCGNVADVGTVEMTYMGVKRNGPAIVCTTCKDSWVEEYLATKTLAAAEGLFEKKKA